MKSPVLLCLLASLALAGVARAHAFLDHADPKVGSTVKSAPRELRLWFDDPLDSSESTAVVTDAAGKRVDKGGATVDAKNPHLLRLALPTLGPGVYKVHWHVLDSDCPHETQGDFTFRVKGS
jgi:methionine-rich copper-binding protein CopC